MPTNPVDWASLATQTGQQALGGIMGIIMGGHERKKQLEQQQKLQQLQITGQKEMTDYQRMSQLQMWKDTNYKAQVEQMKIAGINPALLYGMSGGGGTTAASTPGNVTGGQATGVITNPAQMAATTAQLGLMRAQKENIEADTKNKQAQANKTSGVDTKEAETRIQSLTQGIQNQKAQEALTWLQREIAQIHTRIQGETIEAAMQTITNLAKKSFEEVRELRIENDLSTEQFKDKVRLLKMEIAQIAVHNALMNAQKENVNQDTKNKIQEILESQERMKTMAGQLMINWDKQALDQIHSTEARMEGGNEDWNFIKDMLPTWLIPIGRGFQRGHTPVKGFNK